MNPGERTPPQCKATTTATTSFTTNTTSERAHWRAFKTGWTNGSRASQIAPPILRNWASRANKASASKNIIMPRRLITGTDMERVSPVILSEAKNLWSHVEILRFAQNDRLSGTGYKVNAPVLAAVLVPVRKEL